MAKGTIMQKHSSESLKLNIEQKKEWNQLLKNQEAELSNNENLVGLAERFAQKREEHNKLYAKEKTELLQRQQKELEEYKKIQSSKKDDNELEM